MEVKETKTIFATKNLFILHAFLSIIIALLTVISAYCYLIKQQAKQNYFVPFNTTNTSCIKINPVLIIYYKNGKDK